MNRIWTESQTISQSRSGYIDRCRGEVVVEVRIEVEREVEVEVKVKVKCNLVEVVCCKCYMSAVLTSYYLI